MQDVRYIYMYYNLYAESGVMDLKGPAFRKIPPPFFIVDFPKLIITFTNMHILGLIYLPFLRNY